MNIYVGMSGGVDSAVAALLLIGQGHTVTGVTLRLRDDPAAERDIGDARAVCGMLGIGHRVLDLRGEFRRFVVDPFIAAYRGGRTPNPCVGCNAAIKFGAMMDYALSDGADAVATGHYVSQSESNGRLQLRRDGTNKDQSYFLWRLTQRQLAHAVFPLAGMSKAQVRTLAAAHALPVAQKGDSMDICFIPSGRHADFIDTASGGMPPGDFVNESGTVLGRHGGIHRYTIGQRKGLGIASDAPLYVRRIDAAGNRVVLGGEDTLYSGSITVRDVNWVSILPPDKPMYAQAQIRFAAAPGGAQIIPREGGRAHVIFDNPQRAAAPGQSAVFYNNGLLLGGGEIFESGQRG